MTDAQTEARAIVSAILVDERLAVGYQIETLADAIVEHIATALAAKDAELEQYLTDRDAELSASFDAGHYRAMSEHATLWRIRAERAEAQLAEANKALDAVFEDTQARTKAGMTYGINSHPTLSPATLHIVAQVRFSARRALEAQGGE